MDLQFKNCVLPGFAAQSFLYDMEAVDSALRALIQDEHNGTIKLSAEVKNRIRGMIKVFDAYQSNNT